MRLSVLAAVAGLLSVSSAHAESEPDLLLWDDTHLHTNLSSDAYFLGNKSADADPRSIRAAPHEDINLITILVAADKSGLELLDRDGKRLPVETDSENLIVDAGDMLARITNDVIPATTHRVVNPAGANESRYSTPFFMHPRADARLTCIDSCRGEGAKYPDITADEFLKERLAEIGLTG